MILLKKSKTVANLQDGRREVRREKRTFYISLKFGILPPLFIKGDDDDDDDDDSGKIFSEEV